MKITFEYINEINNRMKCDNIILNDILIKKIENCVKIEFSYSDYLLLQAKLIIDEINDYVKIEMINCDYKKFQYIYLYTIITIQLILNAKKYNQTTKCKQLIIDFIKFIKLFDFQSMCQNIISSNYENKIINSGWFDIKSCYGDCEINAAILVYLLHQKDDNINIGFNDEKYYISKCDLYPDKLQNSLNVNCRIEFKISIYILFMKYLMHCENLINVNHLFYTEDKNIINLDGNILPYTNVYNMYLQNNFMYNSIGMANHLFVSEHLLFNNEYYIYDLNFIHNCSKIHIFIDDSKNKLEINKLNLKENEVVIYFKNDYNYYAEIKINNNEKMSLHLLNNGSYISNNGKTIRDYIPFLMLMYKNNSFTFNNIILTFSSFKYFVLSFIINIIYFNNIDYYELFKDNVAILKRKTFYIDYEKLYSVLTK